LLDGRYAGPSKSLFDAAIQREAAARHIPPETATTYAREHPWAVGEIINHPPAGRSPNVRAQAIDVGGPGSPELGILGNAPDFVREWLRWANPRFSPAAPADEPPVLRTVVQRAARAVKDEELYMDYKIGAEMRGDRAKLPEWYCPVRPCPNDDMGVAVPQRIAFSQM